MSKMTNEKMNLNLSLISLQIRHLSNSPLLNSVSRLKIQNSLFKNMFSPISYNTNNLLISKTIFLNSLSSAIKTKITMTGTFYTPVSLNYQDNVHIEILETTFSDFKDTAIYAYTGDSVEGEMLLTSVLFQKCVSSKEGGCLSTTFLTNQLYKCCADSCQSSVRGHFLAATERANTEIKNTFINRCPESSSASSCIYIQVSDTNLDIGLDASTDNISCCSVDGDDAIAVIDVTKVDLSMYDIVLYCNSGNSIISAEEPPSLIISTSFFYGNTNHDNGVINIYSDQLSTILIQGDFQKNGPPTFVFELNDQSYPSIICNIDAPPVNDIEMFFQDSFNSTKSVTYTFIDIKPNSACFIPEDYQRPKQVTIVISLCSSIIGLVCLISIVGISCDIRNMYNEAHFKFDTKTDQLNTLLV